MFYKDNQAKLLVGSANVSYRALGDVYEMVVDIKACHHGQIVSEYQKVFNDIWNDKYSVDITEEFIVEYEKEYKAKRIFERKARELMIETLPIKPNYMQKNALEQLAKYRKTNDRGLVIAATYSSILKYLDKMYNRELKFPVIFLY